MRLGSVLDTVLQRCPQATIFVALIVGTVNDHEREPQQALVDAFNQFVPGVVNERAKAGKRVKLVDMRAVSGHVSSGNANRDSRQSNARLEIHLADRGWRASQCAWVRENGRNMG